MDMSPAERHKYAEIFSSLNPINGYITGAYNTKQESSSPTSLGPLSNADDYTPMPLEPCLPADRLTPLLLSFSNGLLFQTTGAQARQILMNSGVHINKLGQIWYVRLNR